MAKKPIPSMDIVSTRPNQRKLKTCANCARTNELLMQLEARVEELMRGIRPVVDQGADLVAVDPVTAEPLSELPSERTP